MRRRTATLTAAALLTLAALTGCGGAERAAPPRADRSPSPGSSPTRSVPPSPAPSATPPPAPGTVPPPWLGERVLPTTDGGFGEIRPTPRALRQRRFTLPDRLPPLPGKGFVHRITTPAPDRVIARSTWQPGCPVGRDELSWLRLTFHGFDGRRHTGELLVHRDVADDVVRVFGRLYAGDFPIEEMRITTRAELDAPPTGDGNNTSGFVCRPAVGSSTFSQHAHGLAVDVNPFQNPYSRGDLVLPELASAYLDRSRRRPGMIRPDGPVVQAFAAIGWPWGGAWRTASDRHHFSANGR